MQVPLQVDGGYERQESGSFKSASMLCYFVFFQISDAYRRSSNETGI